MRSRFAFGLIVFGLIVSMAGLAGPGLALAQDPSGEGQMSAQQERARADDLESPTINDYLWIAGSSFKPRSSDIQYDYAGNGCITSLTGGSALNQSFTAPLRVPNGSVLKGVRFYYNDTSAQDSRLSITSYNGEGIGSESFIDHVLVDSTGTGGRGNVYGGLATPYTVNTANRGFVLNWYPVVAGPTMQLCGARLFYDRGTPTVQTAPDAPVAGAPATDVSDPQAPQAYDYFFLAGSSFSRRDSNTAYQYGYSGCTYTTGGDSRFTVDLNMPDGVRVLGARFYYYDNSDTDSIQFYLTDYTGLGTYRDLLNGNSANGGFGTTYVAMGGSYDPYTVDQFDYSLNAIAVGAASSKAQLCGVQVFYQTPAALADKMAAEAAPSAAAPAPGTDMTPAPDITGLQPKAYAHDLQLPQGALAEGVRLYYYNTRLPQGYVETWNYNGGFAEYLGTTTATALSGYSSTYQAFATPYTVDHFSASLGVVPWVVYNPSYRFCGVRVFYTEGTASRYRFIAASSFHPRTSSTRYSYEGGGCVEVTQSSVFIPQATK